MKKNQYNDNNENNFGFEVLTYSSSNEIPYINNSNIKNKESCSEDILKQKLVSLIRNIHNIIFDSRNYKKNIDISSNGFIVGLDEALMDKNDFLENNKITNKVSFEKKNYILEFYLINPKNKNKSILVEKWKMGYIEQDKNISNINYINKKFDIIEKSIITLTRVLPLFNLLKTKEYIIEFKSFQDSKKKAQHFHKKPSSIELVYPELFDLKVKIDYLNKNEIISYFDDNLVKTNIEIRNRVASVDINKLLQKNLTIEKNENLMIKQNSNRKSTFDIQNIINDIIQNNNPGLESSSSDYENCNEVFEDNNKIQTNLNKKDLNLSCLSQYKTEYCTPRDKNNKNNIDNNLEKNSKNFINTHFNENLKNTININMKEANNINNVNNINIVSNINNIKIKNIIGTFQRCKELIDKCPDFDAFNKDKLKQFVFGS